MTTIFCCDIIPKHEKRKNMKKENKKELEESIDQNKIEKFGRLISKIDEASLAHGLINSRPQINEFLKLTQHVPGFLFFLGLSITLVLLSALVMFMFHTIWALPTIVLGGAGIVKSSSLLNEYNKSAEKMCFKLKVNKQQLNALIQSGELRRLLNKKIIYTKQAEYERLDKLLEEKKEEQSKIYKPEKTNTKPRTLINKLISRHLKSSPESIEDKNEKEKRDLQYKQMQTTILTSDELEKLFR